MASKETRSPSPISSPFAREFLVQVKQAILLWAVHHRSHAPPAATAEQLVTQGQKCHTTGQILPATG